MPRTIPNKIEYTKQLLQIDVPYRDIQSILKNKYGSGVSNNTLQKLREEIIDLDALFEELEELRKLRPLVHEVAELRKDIKMYKSLYFELMETLNRTVKNT
jgi:hypothetical protein